MPLLKDLFNTALVIAKEKAKENKDIILKIKEKGEKLPILKDILPLLPVEELLSDDEDYFDDEFEGEAKETSDDSCCCGDDSDETCETSDCETKEKRTTEEKVLKEVQKCKILGCTDKHKARGFCNKHYIQYQKGFIDLEGGKIKKNFSKTKKKSK